MEERTFTLTKEFIELNKLMKFETIAHSGAVAGLMIQDGFVYVNGTKETQKRKKIRKGDIVKVENIVIKVV